MDCLGQGVLCAYPWGRIVLTVLVQEDSAFCGSTICDFGRGLCERRKGEEHQACMREFLSVLDHGCDVTSYFRFRP